MKVLDRSWTNCLRMWKWISGNLPEGFSELRNNIKRFIIEHLKTQWLKEYRFTKPLPNDCFFCAASMRFAEPEGCDGCPAVLVDREFCCMEDDFHYALDPINFYQRILKLNMRRGTNV